MDDREHADTLLAERGRGRFELLPRGRAELDRRVPGWLEVRGRRVGARCAHDVLRHPDGRRSLRSRGPGGRWDWNGPHGGPLATRPTACPPAGLVLACLREVTTARTNYPGSDDDRGIAMSATAATMNRTNHTTTDTARCCIAATMTIRP